MDLTASTTTLHHPYRSAAGSFQNVRDCVFSNPVFFDSAASDNFMKEFAGYTMRGAEFDSSERDPPPRCHPGTRKEIVDRMRLWLRNPYRMKKMLWLVGPAGVGKSAIMQTLAELEMDKTIIATLFFSAANGRSDPHQVVATLAYRIAVQYQPYRSYLRRKLAADPKVMEKSIKAQFSAFIVVPFVKMQIYPGPNPLVILIDGLDECREEPAQHLFLGLISYFTTFYPTIPILWVVASRPEAHITECLSRRRLASSFDKEEVTIDSTEACRDVERFLHMELERIRSAHPVIRSLYHQWPSEASFLKLVAAAQGLFAYAFTVIRFINDMSDPVLGFQLVIDLIDNAPQSDATGSVHPMAQLDRFYRCILSQVPPRDLPYTQEILAYLIFQAPHRPSYNLSLDSVRPSMSSLADWLALQPNVIYGALRRLHSVLAVPLPHEATTRQIIIHHRSFAEFLLDPQRSELESSFGTQLDEKRRARFRALRVLAQIRFNVQPALSDQPSYRQITLTWPYRCTDLREIDQCQRVLYNEAEAAFNDLSIEEEDPPSADFVHALKVMDFTSRLPGSNYVLSLILSSCLPETVRQLEEDGVLQNIPVNMLDPALIHQGRQPVYNKIPVSPGTPLPPSGYVRAFIGNHLKGWIQCNSDLRHIDLSKLRLPPVALSGYTHVWTYDFSTIYHRLDPIKTRTT